MTALVGFGRWGKNIARNLHELGVLHTICDQQISLPHPPVHTTHDFQSLLSPEIRQIFIATPPHTHYPLAKQALLAGKDVFVEKPLCLDLEEAEELVELAKAKNLILMVGHLLRYHPCVVKLAQLIQEGRLGVIKQINATRACFGEIRRENVLWDLMPHDLSVIFSLNNHPVTHLDCKVNGIVSEVIDNATLHLTFENGVKSTVYASWIHPQKEQKLTVIGSESLMVFDDTKPWSEKLMEYPFEQKTLSHGGLQLAPKEARAIEVEPGEPLKDECRHFLSCCKTRHPPKTSGEEGLPVIRILQSALYPNTFKTWDFGFAKAPGFDDRKQVHIVNIDLFTID